MKKSHIFVLLVIILGIRASTEAQEIEYVNSILWTGMQELYPLDDYVYCAFQNGLVVIDVSEPENPIAVSWTHLQGQCKGVFAEGDYAYLAEGASGLFIVDISDPAHPVPVGSCDTPDDAQRVFVQGDYAYVSDVPNGLRIIDISDAGNPALIGNYITEGYIKGVFASGDYVYAAVGTAGLDIIDVSDPSNPILAANFDETLYSATDVFIYDDYAYIAENSSDFRIVDVSDPTNPVYVGREWNHTRARDIVVADDYAYTSNPESGLEIYDVSDPYNIIHIAEYPVDSPLLRYLHLEDNSVYLVDLGAGFHMIDVSEPSNPAYRGAYRQGRGSYRLEANDSYAFVKYSNGFETLDLADPVNPIVIGEFDFGQSIMDIFLGEDFIHIVDPPQIYIVDISDPVEPELVGQYHEQRGFRDFFVEGNYIYMTYTSHSFGILDCSFPEYPYIIGEYQTPGIRVNIGATNGAAMVTSWGRTEIYDVSNPANIYHIGDLDFWPGDIYALGHYFFVRESPGLVIIDVSDRHNPEIVGSCEITGDFQNIFFGYDYLFVACGEDGLEVFDISDPADPSIIGYYDTPGSVRDGFFDGQYIYLADGTSVIILRLSTTGISEDPHQMPEKTSFSQNYPNPFNASTTIRYNLTSDSHTTIEIFDILGRKIETLISGMQTAGSHSVVWQAEDYPSGIFFYKIAAGEYTETRRCVLLK